jgi:glucokinase
LVRQTDEMGLPRSTRQNYYEITRILRDHGPLSRAAVAHQLGRSPATIGRAVDYLLSKDAIRETGELKSAGIGRPSRLLELNSRIATVLTVDLRSTEAYAAVTDLAGNILASQKKRLTQGDVDCSIPELIRLIHHLIDSSTYLPSPAILVIGAPSIVDADRGIIEWAPSLAWIDIPLKSILEKEFNVSVLVENDVNLTALGESWKGGGRQVKKNIVFVSVGTGIGAGIVLNGELYRGATYAAGEVAYFVTDVNVLRDNAGKIGNLESRVGQEGLIRMAQLIAQRYPASQLAELLSVQAKNTQTQDILALAEMGDSAALVVRQELVDILTIVICNIAVLLDPEMIILGGPNDWNWSTLIPSIQDRIAAALLRPVHLVSSELENNALIMGGCYSALELLPLWNR